MYIRDQKSKKRELLKKGIRPRHILAIRKMGENGGNDKQVLKSFGYSDAYIRGGKIKDTKSWKVVSETMLPNELLAEVNLGLLKHKAWQARNQGLDKAYKAKKIYTNGTHIEIGGKYSGLTHQQLAEEVARRIAGLLGSERRTGAEEKQ